MSCSAIDIRLIGKKVIKKLGALLDGNVQGYSFSPPKSTNPQRQAFRCTRSLHGILCNSGCSDYGQLQNNLPRDIKGEYYAEKAEKCEILGSFLV